MSDAEKQFLEELDRIELLLTKVKQVREKVYEVKGGIEEWRRLGKELKGSDLMVGVDCRDRFVQMLGMEAKVVIKSDDPLVLKVFERIDGMLESQTAIGMSYISEINALLRDCAGCV